jgi:hypothetical protein
MWLAPEMLLPIAGPMAATGSIVVSSRAPPSEAMKSHAARSLRVLLFPQASTPGPWRTVQSYSVKAWSLCGCPPAHGVEG